MHSFYLCLAVSSFSVLLTLPAFADCSAKNDFGSTCSCTNSTCTDAKQCYCSDGTGASSPTCTCSYKSDEKFPLTMKIPKSKQSKLPS